MRDRPNGADLLDVARRSLLDDVAPSLKGQPRYVALMVANAMGIVAREIEQEGRARRAQEAVLANSGRSDAAGLTELVDALRAGRRDGDAALYEALSESVEVAAQIWKPGASSKR